MDYLSRRWGLLAALVALPGFVLVNFLEPWRARDLFCVAGEVCAREWISALSGWAAVVAAVITVHFLRVQIVEANRHQRENVELTIMAKIATAKNFTDALRDIRVYVDCAALQYFADLPDGSEPSGREFTENYQFLEDMTRVLGDERLLQYQREIGLQFPLSMTTNMLDYLKSVTTHMRLHVAPQAGIPVADAAQVRGAARDIIRNLDTFIMVGRDEADLFVRRWSAIYGGQTTEAS